MRVLFVFGTRPEAIKLAPLVGEFRASPALFDTRVCVTAQHREMLDQVLAFFDIIPDVDLDIMSRDQSLFRVTAQALQGLEAVLSDYKPDWVVVQGDTTTTFTAALAAFYRTARVAHIEAGLRSHDKYAPYPEEMNRILTSRLADLHFAPTERARENLLRESVEAERIFVVGNTSIDALFLCLRKIASRGPEAFPSLGSVDFGRRILLVTGHRRESFGAPFERICRALKAVAMTNDVEIVYPVHLNPHVRRPVFEILGGVRNVHLIEPLDYPSFVWLMNRSYLIITDSGGIQEEAPSLGKPVLVMREVTERVEGVEAGTARLVGTDHDMIVTSVQTLLDDAALYERMAKAVNPYGDGTACRRIREVIGGIRSPRNGA